MFRTILAASILLAMAVAVPAQAQYGVGRPPFSTDLSKADAQRVSSCYLALSVIHNFETPGGMKLERQVVGLGDEYFSKLTDGYRVRLNELLKAAGQSATADDVIAPQLNEMRKRAMAKDPMLSADFARDQSRACLVGADREMVGFRAVPALDAALTCWAFMATMKDPDGALMEMDLDLVLSRRQVRTYVATGAKELLLGQAQALLAGPQAEAVKARLKGCPAQAAPALRQAAWEGRSIAVDERVDTYNLMRQDLRNGGARDDAGLKALIDQRLWSAENADLMRWAASNAVSAALCGTIEPWRGATRAGTATPMDIALDRMKALGFTVPVSYMLIASVRNYYGSTFDYAYRLGPSCNVLNEAEARRMGLALVHVPQPK